MQIDEAEQWIEELVDTGTVDPRTYETTCRELVTYYDEHPDDQGIIQEAVIAVFQGRQWAETTPRQADNAVYIAVNLNNLQAIEKYVADVADSDDPRVELIESAIAAIRSLEPAPDLIRPFLPPLVDWLKNEKVAARAFEALYELSPGHAAGYLHIISDHHNGQMRLLQQAISHVFFRDGDTEGGSERLREILRRMPSLADAVQGHPFLPDDAKHDLQEFSASSSSAPNNQAGEEGQQAAFPPRQLVRTCREAQLLVRAVQGISWGGKRRVAS